MGILFPYLHCHFFDTGLLCSLPGLRAPGNVGVHHMRGSLYEDYVIAEYIKRQYHEGIRPVAYFWRDHSGHEVDLIIEQGETVHAVEIKSSETLHPDLFDGLRWFSRQAGIPVSNCTLAYGGQEEQSVSAGRVLPWMRAHLLPCGNAESL